MDKSVQLMYPIFIKDASENFGGKEILLSILVHVASRLTSNKCCLAYQIYQERIPNGELVPFPYKLNNLWKGVGHCNILGGGTLNSFGRDFQENGSVWTRSLCMLDSDGDERTNGEELGDPGCTWTPNQGPPAQPAQSHPGICEPIDSDMCRKLSKSMNCEGWKYS